jgi:mono/diheme cytochrome c family protein
MNRMKYTGYFSAGLFVAAAFLVSSCSKDPQGPGYEFMPDMYRSVGYEAYGPNKNFTDGSNARKPVDGTIAYQTDRSKLMDVFPYSNSDSPEGYAAAASLKNPIPFSDQVLEEGKAVYTNFCIHCHGQNGQGDGGAGKKQAVLIPPAYNSDQLKNLPEGQIFHSITYGKNAMGAHQYQISKTDRWKLVHYVQSLQKYGAETAVATDSTAVVK